MTIIRRNYLILCDFILRWSRVESRLGPFFSAQAMPLIPYI